MSKYPETALGKVTSYGYDLNGSIRELVDALGRLVSETDAMGGVTRYEYDANGLVTAVIDALEQREEMVYDGMGNVTEILSPDGGITRFSYDLAGTSPPSPTPRGGAMGSATSQRFETGTINWSDVRTAGIINGGISMFAGIFNKVPTEILADTSTGIIGKVVGSGATIVNEIIADTSSSIMSS